MISARFADRFHWLIALVAFDKKKNAAVPTSLKISERVVVRPMRIHRDRVKARVETAANFGR